MAGETGNGHNAPMGVWVAVALIIGGSIMSGVALIEWFWPVFWVGVGLMVGGGVLALVSGIMDSVSEFAVAPPQQPEAS